MSELPDYFDKLFKDIKRLQEANKQVLSALDDPCAWYEYLKFARGLFVPANETTMGDTLATPAKARIAATMTNHLRLMHKVAIALKQRRPAERSTTSKPKAERREFFSGLMTILKNLLVKVLPEMVLPAEYGDLQSLCNSYRPGIVNDDFILSLGFTAEKMFDWHKRLDAESTAEFIRQHQLEYPSQYSRKVIVPTRDSLVFTDPIVTDQSHLTRARKRSTSDRPSKTQLKILLILKGKYLTKMELAGKTGFDPDTINENCQKLLDKQLIDKREGGGYFSKEFPPPDWQVD